MDAADPRADQWLARRPLTDHRARCPEPTQCAVWFADGSSRAGRFTGAANLTIQFRERSIPGQALCNTFIDKYPNFVITRVRVVITSLNRQQRRHCIVEELTQSLGLVNDSPLVFPSIFNDSSRQQELHAWDELMVQTLYNPRLYPGITVRKARPIFRAILAELIAQTPVTTDSPPPTATPGTAPERPDKSPGQFELDPSAFED